MTSDVAETAKTRPRPEWDLGTLMKELSRRYCWDSDPGRAAAETPRIILRTLNVGTWDDILELERIAGRRMLRDVVSASGVGALTPRSWAFWNYRLGLADVDHPPRPPPSRRVP